MSNYQGSRNSNRRSRNNNFRSRRSSSGGRRRHYSNHRRSRGENIPVEKYIAKADANYVAPSIFVEDQYYDNYRISKGLKINIKNKGYIHPTKIQHQSIPHILDGRDILGLASTGSGKTGAFLIPSINKVANDPTQKCLIICPTRELASQIQDELIELSRNSRIFSTLVIGGVGIGSQIRQLRRNPQYVIGTPGRLKDHFERRTLDLGSFNNIVLDEVDRMLDMGFIPDITYLMSKIRQQRQTMFFSATMNNKTEVIANTLLEDPVRVQVEKESPLKSVNQDVVRVQKIDQKGHTLVKMLNTDEFQKVLIFSRTKRGADKLSRSLYSNGLKVDSIHGDKAQNKRIRVLDSFKSNKIDILVATDVAARGLDIPNVTHVINYDEPETYKDYIHRIGRTGRAGKPGNALTFVVGR